MNEMVLRQVVAFSRINCDIAVSSAKCHTVWQSVGKVPTIVNDTTINLLYW